ncbi:hypothetical protein Fmac_024541 [Flemingia macrophylla]|uniref:Uncharacterized protein n=1 Tax=Flemingia macrophylla TaxID=520843 RepID=A0ABD1LPN3_9FABA
MLLHLKSSVTDPAGLLSIWIIAKGPNSAHYSWSNILCMETPAFSMAGGGARLGSGIWFVSGESTVACSIVFLGNCGRLRTLLSYSNLLEKDTPVELWKLKSLEVLDVSKNTLNDFVPKELGSCSKLAVLVLLNLFV